MKPPDSDNDQPHTLKWKKTDSIPTGGNRVVCSIKDECKTCEYINGPYERSLNLKYQSALALLREKNNLKNTQLIEPVPSREKLYYRTHAKLAFSALGDVDDPQIKFSLIRNGQIEKADLTNCPLHRPLITRFFNEVTDLIKEPTTFNALKDDLKIIAIRVSHLTDEVMITFIVAQPIRNHLKQLVARLKRRDFKISSSYMNLPGEKLSKVFSDESSLISGTQRMRITLCDLTFEVTPTAAFPVNPSQSERMYRRFEHLCGERSGSDIAWDLYCGSGIASLTLAKSGWRTLGVDKNPQAVRDAQNNAIKNELQAQLYFLPGEIEDLQGTFPNWSWPPGLIHAKPPKVGMTAQVRLMISKAMTMQKNCQLIYHATDIESFSRDLKSFEGEGFVLRQLEAFDFFPYTKKIDFLAVIMKN